MKLDFSHGRQARGAAIRRTAVAAGGLFITSAPSVDWLGAAHAQAKAAGTYAAAKTEQIKAADPLQPNQAIRDIAALVMGSAADTKGRIAMLFEYLRVGAPSGLQLVESTGRPPRTAAEAVQKGGDCTEFASVALSAINAMNATGAGIKAEALIVHFEGSPEGMQHMIVEAEINGRMTIVDLQSGALGTTKKGRYETVLRLPPEQAATIYFQEMGDHLSDHNAADAAIAAYERAAEICPANAEANKGAAAKYERKQDWNAALARYRAAVAANPAYAKDTARARYYMEYANGESAAGAGAWGKCADCFRRARLMLDLHPLPAKAEAQERATVEQNIGVCERNAAKTGK